MEATGKLVTGLCPGFEGLNEIHLFIFQDLGVAGKTQQPMRRCRCDLCGFSGGGTAKLLLGRFRVRNNEGK